MCVCAKLSLLVFVWGCLCFGLEMYAWVPVCLCMCNVYDVTKLPRACLYPYFAFIHSLVQILLLLCVWVRMLSPLSPTHILRMCLQYFGVLLLLLLRREWVLAVSVYILALFLRIGSMSGLYVRLAACLSVCMYVCFFSSPSGCYYDV